MHGPCVISDGSPIDVWGVVTADSAINDCGDITATEDSGGPSTIGVPRQRPSTGMLTFSGVAVTGGMSGGVVIHVSVFTEDSSNTCFVDDHDVSLISPSH